MSLSGRQRIVGAALVAIALALLGWGVSAYRRHAEAESAFAFVRELADFSEAHGRLPTSIREFCQWTHDEEGHYVWDPEVTARKVEFLWLVPGFSPSNSSRFLLVADPALKKYETALNEQIAGRIPLDVLMRTSGSDITSPDSRY